MGQSSSLNTSSRSSSHTHSTNNLPPLLFHNVHGENIRIFRDGTVAKRVESFCKGIAFSSRPVKVNEKVCLKFLEISNNWSGVIRIGFTSNDPTNMRYGLPKYACPDLTNKPGFWAKALPERFCNQNNILFYYVTSTGDVHFGINGEEKGIFFGGVETRGPVWALIDVYGNSTAVEFVDIRHQLNNSRSAVTPTPPGCEAPVPIAHPRTPDPVDRITYPMQQLHIQQIPSQPQIPTSVSQSQDLNLPLLRFQPHNVNYQAMPLHRTRGRNVRFCGGNRSVAMRTDTEFCQGYVFTARPIQIGERVAVQILATEPMFQGCLGLGLTSCDPGSLTTSDLPDDSNFLLDRPEYWVLSRDFARNLNKGDEVSFCVSPTGEVQISKNGGAPLVVMHVDQSLRLWAFFDIYGSTQRIRVLSGHTPTNLTTSPLRNSSSQSIIDRRHIATSESINSLNMQNELSRQGSNSSRQSLVVRDAEILPVHASRPTQTPQNGRLCFPQADIQVQPAANGGAVLSVILPPAAAINHHGYGNHTSSPMSPVTTIMAPVPTTSSAIASGTMMSNCSAQYVEPITASDSSTYSTPLSWAEQNGTGTTHTLTAGAECTICYENPIDAVLYMCGHMCMCYDCALQQWRGKGGGHCPLCRAVIRDVIRTYKS
ncbi:protein neuralized isoform X2 [Anthonomus grandis grandis]|uniref:protein neuralized isoform X2 n=1 Tax=Anthonomus grandis grandis TaxID=2921223 RepID=UPI00216661F5|nr:protein neuralized isoform X2 [Anthonomus grandis grandis]